MTLEAALLSPPGEGGISVVLVAGPGAADFISERLRTAGGAPKPLAPGKLAYGFYCDSRGERLDEVIVACADMSRVEVNCHGGAVPARRVLEDLLSSGVRLLGGDGALDACYADGIQREAARALLGALTELAARVFAAQLGGALASAIEEVERALSAEPADVGRARALLSRLADSSRLGLALAGPRRVAVVGPVNAGKSTLVNVLAGFERNIVSPIAGTTRDAVEVPISLFGVPVTLIDTAGAGVAATALDEAAQDRARSALGEAAAVVVVVDASAPLPRDFAYPLNVKASVIAANKRDLAADSRTLEMIDSRGAPVVETSGVTGLALDRLSEMILRLLDVPLPGKGAAAQAVVFTKRQLKCVARALQALGTGGSDDRAELTAELKRAALCFLRALRVGTR